MRVIRDFKCTNEDCGEVINKFIDSDVKEVDCDLCGSISNRLLSAPRVKGNTTGRSPSYSKFNY
jgi:hypothetical protein